MELKTRFELTDGGMGGKVSSDAFDYLRASKIGNGNGNGNGNNNGNSDWEDVREGELDEEVFLQRALAAIKTAGVRGDGMVEMEEREWKAWKRHEAMEREIEKRVAEREMEREMQRERDLARAEELQRELDMLRQSALSQSRNGAFGASGGEPGIMVDQRFAPFGAGYASNSSSSSSLPAKTARPYSTFTTPHRETRFMPDSTDPLFVQNLRPTLPPREQPREYQAYSSSFHPTSSHLTSQQPSPTPSYLQPVQPAQPAQPVQPVQPVSKISTTTPSRRTSSRSSSLTRDGGRSKRSITSSTSVPPGADLAPGGSYHPGTHPSIPTSKSTGALSGKSERESKKKGKKGSDAEEEVYTSAAAALKDARRRRRL